MTRRMEAPDTPAMVANVGFGVAITDVHGHDALSPEEFRMRQFVSPDRTPTRSRSEEDFDFDVYSAQGEVLVSGFGVGEFDANVWAEFRSFVESFGGVRVERFPFGTPRMHACCALRLIQLAPDETTGHRRFVWAVHEAHINGPEGWSLRIVDELGLVVKEKVEVPVALKTWEEGFSCPL